MRTSSMTDFQKAHAKRTMPAIRAVVDLQCRPKLKPFAVMRRDELRGHWVVLSPERIMTLDQVAVAILKLCDGERCVIEIVKALSKRFEAPSDVIEGDVIEFLQELSDQILIDL